MICETPEKIRARAEKNGYKNGTQFGSLESQVMFDKRLNVLLKTPCAADSYADKMKSKGVSGTSGALAQEIVSGYAEKFRGLMLPTPQAGEAEHYRMKYTPGSQMGQSLSAMAGSGMLPTPTARDYKNPSSPDGERITRKQEQGWTIELSDLAAMKVLPTPSARDYKGKTNPGIVKEGSGCVYGETLPDAIDRYIKEQESALIKESQDVAAGQTSRLSPLFTEEMMGFPLMWTTLPFLSQSGERNPSKPTEMQ